MSLLRPLSTLAACLCAATLAAPVAALGAQGAPPPPPVPHRNAIATNFIGIPFGLFSFEYERATALPGFSVGIGGSHFAGDLDDGDEFDGGDDRESWAEAKVMYYPGERAFRGFAVGITGGVHSARGFACEGSDPFGGCTSPGTVRSETAPTLGVLVNYDWLIGRQDRFRVGLGVGAKRVLKDVNENRDVLSQVYPDGRFVIGLTF